jgi:hypothetical protein
MGQGNAASTDKRADVEVVEPPPSSRPIPAKLALKVKPS